MTDSNINIAKCLKDTSDFGVTHVHNICNGTVSNVPWGGADWAVCLIITGLGIAAICVSGAMAFDIFSDAIRNFRRYS